MGKPTKEQLARYCELKAKNQGLDRESRALESELHALHEAIVEHMTEVETKACKIHGFHLVLLPGQVRPKWKDEFIRVAGVPAATLVEETTERGEQLQVLPPTKEKSEE